MVETIDLGSTPHYVLPLGHDHPDYSARNHQLAVAYINQVRRYYGHPPRGAGLYISTRRRAWGRTSSVTLYFDETNDAATAYAMGILLDINQALDEWDERSKVTLGPQRIPRIHTVWDHRGGMINIEQMMKRWAA